MRKINLYKALTNGAQRKSFNSLNFETQNNTKKLNSKKKKKTKKTHTKKKKKQNKNKRHHFDLF